MSEPKKRTPRKNFTVRLTEEESNRLREEATKEIRTTGGLIRKIIAEYLKSRTGPSSPRVPPES